MIKWRLNRKYMDIRRLCIYPSSFFPTHFICSPCHTSICAYSFLFFYTYFQRWQYFWLLTLKSLYHFCISFFVIAIFASHFFASLFWIFWSLCSFVCISFISFSSSLVNFLLLLKIALVWGVRQYRFIRKCIFWFKEGNYGNTVSR